MRPSCARAHARSASTRDVRFPAWVSDEELEGLWALAAGVRVPLAVRGLRPARARGDGARRAGRLLERLLAAGGGRRRGAAVRPARRGAPSPRRSRRLLEDPALREQLRARGLERVREFTLGAHRAPDARELRPRARVRVALEHDSQRVLERQRLGVLRRTSSRCSRAARSPPRARARSPRRRPADRDARRSCR